MAPVLPLLLFARQLQLPPEKARLPLCSRTGILRATRVFQSSALSFLLPPPSLSPSSYFSSISFFLLILLALTVTVLYTHRRGRYCNLQISVLQSKESDNRTYVKKQSMVKPPNLSLSLSLPCPPPHTNHCPEENSVI